ncbi:PAS domain-containing protein [Halorubrum sp. HHNYT27]|uniref:PAS domain-containing protein n=1 Tax=Halorubrum sp. HHNYT27 TaxID=3402275 RepID=UPI003EBA130C
MDTGSERSTADPSSGDGNPAAEEAVGDAPERGPLPPEDDPCVLLFMRPGRDRELVANALSDRFTVESTTDVETLDSNFDCCVFDANEFSRAAGSIQRHRDRADPVFLPFVLLLSDGATEGTVGNAWDYVDDVITLPVRRRTLSGRIANLVQRRRTSLQLAARERELSDTVEDLRLKEQAMDEAPVGISIADQSEMGEADNPLVYTNLEFESLTGYGSEAIGVDCRFLQGEATDPETIATIRAAIDAERPVAVDILNYRRNGQAFWNQLTIAPVRDEAGEVTHFVGFQSDITDRKIRERRLEVMNRVLSHNLRNKMNLITGYAELLQQDAADMSMQSSLDRIATAANELTRIANEVQKVDRVLSTPSPARTKTELRSHLTQLRSRLEDAYPDVTIELSMPSGDPLETTAVGLLEAVEEAAENAAKHIDAPGGSVEIHVERESPEWIAIEVTDDGPGIPDHETSVLGRGETSVTHGSGLGLWKIHWIVGKAGGDFTIESSSEGSTLRIRVPAHP